MAVTPAAEDLHGGLEQFLSDASTPEVGTDTQRTKESDAPPVGREIGPDHLAVQLSRDRGFGIHQPSGAHAVGVAGTFHP